MRVRIDRSNCAGHGRCAAVAGELFSLDEVGYISTIDFEVKEGFEDIARKGARSCPERAITIEE